MSANRNRSRMNRIPEEWECYSKIGYQINGTQLVCFKCPLRQEISLNVERRYGREAVWGIDDLMSVFEARGQRLGLVIDLTDTKRYYNAADLEARGVHHMKLSCPGSHALPVPPESLYREFEAAVDDFLRNVPIGSNVMIGVHCTHGLNRTGYFVCRYIVERLGYGVEEAETLFNAARGHEIEKKHYLESIGDYWRMRDYNNYQVKQEQEDMSNQQLDTTGSDSVVRVRGLPWSCTEQQLRAFFKECVDGILKIHFTFSREGRPNGEAYIEFSKDGYVLMAMKKNKEYMGQRYVEVFEATRAEMEYVLRRNGKQMMEEVGDDGVVRLRGLPFDATEAEVAEFFNGMTIAPNGILIMRDAQERPSGEAYVKFTTPEDAKNGIKTCNMGRIGRRYIEVFASSEEEVKKALRNMQNPRFSPYDRPPRGGMRGRGGPPGYGGGGPRGGGGMRGLFGGRSEAYGGGGGPMGRGGGGGGGGFDRWSGASYNASFANDDPWDDGYGGGAMRFGGGGGRGAAAGWGGGRGGGPPGRGAPVAPRRVGHFVHLRGLPWTATDADIHEFFKPLQLKSVNIELDEQGRPSGDADVEFYNHEDAAEAMKKDKDKIGTRYIELFLNSSKKPAMESSAPATGFGAAPPPPAPAGGMQAAMGGPAAASYATAGYSYGSFPFGYQA